MVTVGSLAYSIVADTKNFSAGVANSKAELRTLRKEMQDSARGTDELTSAFDKIDRRLGRLTISEVMGQLRAIPGLTIAIDAAFGNWIGVAVGAFTTANELIKEQSEALDKTADAYENATTKLVGFFEAEEKARQKGRANDRVTGLPADAEKAAQELGMGRLGYSASNTFAGVLERLTTRLAELQFNRTGSTREEAVELGRKQIRDEMESRRLAITNTPEAVQARIDEQSEAFYIRINAQREAAREAYDLEVKAAEEAAKIRIETANRVVEMEGRVYEKNERAADAIAHSQMTPAEKLREELDRLQELNEGGFFDLHPGTYERALGDLRDKAEGMLDTRGDRGVTDAVMSASREGIAARFGSGNISEKQLREQVKQNEQQRQTNIVLNDIKTIIANNPGIGVMK